MPSFLKKLFAFAFRAELAELQQFRTEKTNHTHELENAKKIALDASCNLENCKKETASIKNELAKAKTTIGEHREKLDFLAKLVNSVPAYNEALQDYEYVLNNDYLDFANGTDCLPSDASEFLKLKDIAEQLKLIADDKDLLNKSVIAVAGSFSSGKSAFINSLFSDTEIELPMGMDQTTAICSYVMSGERDIAGYSSYNNAKVGIPENLFKLFSYGKIESFGFNMKRLIDHIIIKNRFVKEYENLCFIDTPGFNAGQESREDHSAAFGAISNAHAIIWLFNSRRPLTNDELDILQEITEKFDSVKIYFVATYADLPSEEELQQVLDEVQDQLSLYQIPFKGLTPYSSKRIQDNAGYAQLAAGCSLDDFLASCNKNNYLKKEGFIKQIKEVFAGYVDACEKRIKRSKERLKLLKLIESIFYQMMDEKDEKIDHLTARMDKTFLKQEMKNSQRPKEGINIPEDSNQEILTAGNLLPRFFALLPVLAPDDKDDKKTENLQVRDIPDDDEDDAADQDDEIAFTNSIDKMKKELKKTIAKDTADAKTAKELSEKMQKAVIAVFA